MPKKRLALLASFVFSLASCSPEEPGPTATTPQAPSRSETEARAEAKTKTIALAEKTAEEPPALPRPPEHTESEPIRTWQRVTDLSARVAIFDTVFWDPRDTVSLRKLISTTPLVKDKVILEIGTGSGLISLYCLEFGARKVVATDVNRMAVANALYNAKHLGFEDRFEARLVPLDDPSAYRVIGASERFDLVISNPPWENAEPKRIFEYAYFDPNFVLLRSLLDGLRDHLNPDGKALLAYGAVDGIQHLMRYSADNVLSVRILDDRKLEDLPPVFVPGMLLEVSF
jgi:methylase of polypeptide subunit release factors